MMKPLISSKCNYVLEIYLKRKSFDFNELERQKSTWNTGKCQSLMSDAIYYWIWSDRGRGVLLHYWD